MTTTIDKIAEAKYQLQEATKSGIRKTMWSDDRSAMIMFHNNGTIVTNRFNGKLEVQFQLNNQPYAVTI